MCVSLKFVFVFLSISLLLFEFILTRKVIRYTKKVPYLQKAKLFYTRNYYLSEDIQLFKSILNRLTPSSGFNDRLCSVTAYYSFKLNSAIKENFFF